MLNRKNKLIRDYIPQLISESENQLKIEQLSDLEYQQALRLKLVEEATEVKNAIDKEELIEEIADLYEVIDTIITFNNLNPQDILTKQQEKREQKGGFKQKLKLSYTQNNELFANYLSLDEKELLQEIENYLKDIIAPLANVIDSQSQPLKKALEGMGKQSLLTLKIPKVWGGREISELGFHRFQMLMATYSGALTFLQTQHQSAASFLNASNNESLKKRYLEKMATGEVLFGVGFSHLRRKGKPMMTAIPVNGGYELTGIVPWITGYDFFSHFIIGASLPDGQELYGVMPFTNTQQSEGGKIEFSQPMNLMAMNSTNTVSGKVEKWFISDDDIVNIQPANHIHQRDQKNVLNQGFFCLGCASAALRILINNGQKKQFNFIEDTHHRLTAELTAIHQEILVAITQSNYTFEQKLQLRAKTINLAYRCASCAVISSSGVANQQNNDAARVYREVLLFSVSGQTQEIMEASLTLF